MTRFILAFLILVHGAIHLLGFLKEWKLAEVKQLTGNTLIPLSDTAARSAGALWFVVFLAFLAAAWGLMMKNNWWWMVGFGAVVLSQLLIVVYWRDAWAGTFANLIILPFVIVSWAGWSFDTMVREETGDLFGTVVNSPGNLVTREMLNGLPPPVRRFLENSNVVGRPAVASVRLKQSGTMMTKQGGDWVPFEAEQYFTVDPPAFIWKARMQAAPLIDVAARDKYQNGRGNMLIKALSLIPIADSKGPEMDQGTLLRYLAEMTWFPSSLVSNYITWEPIDSVSARATMNYGGVSASGVFSFTERGDLIGFEAKRYGEFDGKYSLETWSIGVGGYRLFDGYRIPQASEVTWKLKSGNWTWLRLEITELEFNRPESWNSKSR
jgi:hypothetical protein